MYVQYCIDTNIISLHQMTMKAEVRFLLVQKKLSLTSLLKLNYCVHYVMPPYLSLQVAPSLLPQFHVVLVAL
jgi:hypothetical protein